MKKGIKVAGDRVHLKIVWYKKAFRDAVGYS